MARIQLTEIYRAKGRHRQGDKAISGSSTPESSGGKKTEVLGPATKLKQLQALHAARMRRYRAKLKNAKRNNPLQT